MDANDTIRKMVSENYANAVARPTPGCGCAGERREPQAKGLVAKLAGYREEELRKLPEDAVVNSFGCGNPIAFSEVGPGDVVLDLGSGAGLDLLIAAEKVGPTGRVIGVDMTDEMIARARANIAAAGLTNVEVRKGIIEELPVETGSVDWVISNCVINLSPEKDRVFSEIARVLKPGGRMMVSDMVVHGMPEWVRENAALYSSCVAGAISEEAYLDGLRRAGLEQVEVKARFVYDASQLSSFVDSEPSGEVIEAMSCCGGGSQVSRARLEELAKGFEGKIWSAKFAARKPAA
jgi:arsenite methyltransferase